jgi:hypothetical protein
MRVTAPESGASLLEIVFAAGVLATIAAMSASSLLAAVDDFRTLGAVRYLSSRLHETRMEAVMRSSNAAMRFSTDNGEYAFAIFVDGNGDGVRSADIQRGLDPELRRQERLSDHFRGVAFGAGPDIPPVDPAGTAPGDDPIRIGASDLLSFTALGTATPGSLYVRGPRGTQYVVRVLGETGRTRILRFDRNGRRWKAL